jgi:hypothetical protein
MIEHHQIGTMSARNFANFGDFAFAGKQRRIGRRTPAANHRNGSCASTAQQQLELRQTLLLIVFAEVKLNQHRRFAASWSFKHSFFPHLQAQRSLRLQHKPIRKITRP